MRIEIEKLILKLLVGFFFFLSVFFFLLIVRSRKKCGGHGKETENNSRCNFIGSRKRDKMFHCAWG